jgi:aspartyl-tRNA(Asn)/glutamyl-tRNA(Gln) amidotransferase subunit C
MTLDRQDVVHLAELAKLSLSDQELDLFAQQLSEILDAAAHLNELDTESISPTASVLPLLNVWRADVAKPSLSHDEVMANAPETDSQKAFFKVKAVLD